ncbi:AraC family L-rhamnose operon regulatory protein RhaS [Fontibacillus phaseoli]|uniref:AraC family L-rhamnose operon regulatory protein RhaS n=2 Tax=Fontibacillus phaseoli TaxID=1416533 RepID=A0A369BB35_9BACL|nr:AraC family L-rhamnose operon regulatory protein RhaS [Fontibacillus phaseoli]
MEGYVILKGEEVLFVMMPFTEGKIHYPGYRLGMSYCPEAPLSGDGDELSGYRLVLVLEGAGIMQIGELAYPVMGSAIYCFHDRETVTLPSKARIAGKALFFQPGVLNERLNGLLPGGESVGHACAEKEIASTDVQDLWVLEPFLDRGQGYYGGIPLDPSVARHADELLKEIGYNLHFQPDAHWPCRSRSYLLELLFLIRRIYQQTTFSPAIIPSEVPESVKPVLEYLHTHYTEKIRLEDLTSRFHVNKTTLNEQFKKSTGLSLIAYLNKIRMQMADSMLRNTTLPTTEIMERIGFADDAHFLRNFRKYSGYSPAEFRNAYCWMLNKNS